MGLVEDGHAMLTHRYYSPTKRGSFARKNGKENVKQKWRVHGAFKRLPLRLASPLNYAAALDKSKQKSSRLTNRLWNMPVRLISRQGQHTATREIPW